MHPRTWLRGALWYAAVWTVLVAVWALEVGPSNQQHGRVDWGHYFALSAINFYSTAVVAIPLTVIAWQRGLGPHRLLATLAFYAAIIAATSIARFVLFLPLLAFVTGSHYGFLEELRIAFAPQFVGLSVMLAVLLAIRSVQLANDLTVARLDALQAQLHPHFLFNTLNAVSTLMHTNVEEADEMLARLCDLLRVTLQTPRTAISLEEELTIISQYVGIMERRFPGKLRLIVDIPEEMRAMPVPPLLLQPLVENALQHGLNRTGAVTDIRLSARRADAMILLRVGDNGPGLDPTTERRAGIGIENTRRRLWAFYGKRARLSIRNAETSGAEVLLEMPFGARR